MIVARRDWATNTTTLTVVQGGTDRVLPPLTVTPLLASMRVPSMVSVPDFGGQ